MSSRAPDLFGDNHEAEQARQTQAREAPQEAVCDGCLRGSAIYDFGRDCCLIRWIDGQRNRKGAAQWIESKYGAERMQVLRQKWTETVKKIRNT